MVRLLQQGNAAPRSWCQYPAGRLSSAIAPFKMTSNPSQHGDRQGNMGELITRFVARTGLDRMIAEQSTGVIYILPPRVSE
jgi:hypothetical protein